MVLALPGMVGLSEDESDVLLLSGQNPFACFIEMCARFVSAFANRLAARLWAERERDYI